MKKGEKPSVWKEELKNGLKEFLVELIIPFSVMAIALIIALLLPTSMIQNIPTDVLFILAGVALFIVFGAITLGVYIIKEVKNKNNTNSHTKKRGNHYEIKRFSKPLRTKVLGRNSANSHRSWRSHR